MVFDILAHLSSHTGKLNGAHTINEEVIFDVLLLTFFSFVVIIMERSGYKGKEKWMVWRYKVTPKKNTHIYMILTSTLRIYIYCTWGVNYMNVQFLTSHISYNYAAIVHYYTYFLLFFFSLMKQDKKVYIFVDQLLFSLGLLSFHLFSLVCFFRSVGLWYYNIFHYQSNALRREVTNLWAWQAEKKLNRMWPASSHLPPSSFKSHTRILFSIQIESSV